MASATSALPAPTVAGRGAPRLALYSPALPPARGGVADHTYRLARALEARGASPVVLGRTGEPATFAPIVTRVGVTPRDGARGLVPSVRDCGARAILVQYVPFLFGRLGLAPSLVVALRGLRRAGVRVGVFLHEPYVPLTRPVWWLTGPPMRWQFRAVVRLADVVFAPVPRFLALARRVARAATRLVPSPVGATIPVSRATRVEARAALELGEAEIAVGVFCPRSSGALPGWVRHAAAALGETPVRWIFFGTGSETPPDGFPAARVRGLGWLEPERAARVFRALDVAVAPFDDGLTLRRTSAMAALAHAVPLLSSRGELFDPALGQAALCADTPDDFAAELRRLIADRALRAAWGERGHAFYVAEGSMDVLVTRLLTELGAA